MTRYTIRASLNEPRGLVHDALCSRGALVDCTSIADAPGARVNCNRFYGIRMMRQIFAAPIWRGVLNACSRSPSGIYTR